MNASFSRSTTRRGFHICYRSDVPPRRRLCEQNIHFTRAINLETTLSGTMHYATQEELRDENNLPSSIKCSDFQGGRARRPLHAMDFPVPASLTPTHAIIGGIAFFALLFVGRSQTSRRAEPYPPGPRALPLIGSKSLNHMHHFSPTRTATYNQRHTDMALTRSPRHAAVQISPDLV